MKGKTNASAVKAAEIKITTIRINQATTDPATMITRIADEGGIELIRASSHRYTGMFSNGVMTLKKLSDTDGTRYADGTSATLTTIGTDVWMKLPQFWYKCTRYATDQWDFSVAYGGRPDSSYKEWDGKDLIGVYEAYNSSSKLYSVSGKVSTVNVSQSNFKEYARARGTGFTLVKWKHHCMMAMLFYTQYGQTNCQAKIGAGTSSYKDTGATNALGMTDTVAGGNGDSNSINFWGLENWWGNKYEWVDNVSVNNGVFEVTEDSGYARKTGTQVGTDGYITKMLFGANIDLIPVEASGSATTGFCDYNYYDAGTHVVLRSYSYSNARGGVAFVNTSSSSSNTSSDYGSRLAFRGEYVIV